MATENFIMALVKRGVSRQDAHEQLRVLSHQAAAVVRNGGDNDLVDRMRRTEFFQPILADLDQLMDPKTFIGKYYFLPPVTEGFEMLIYMLGRAPQQVE